MDYIKIFVYATRWQYHNQCLAIAEHSYGKVLEKMPQGANIVRTDVINPPEDAWAEYCYTFYKKA